MLKVFGAGEGARTLDPDLGKVRLKRSAKLINYEREGRCLRDPKGIAGAKKTPFFTYRQIVYPAVTHTWFHNLAL